MSIICQSGLAKGWTRLLRFRQNVCFRSEKISTNRNVFSTTVAQRKRGYRRKSRNESTCFYFQLPTCLSELKLSLALCLPTVIIIRRLSDQHAWSINSKRGRVLHVMGHSRRIDSFS